MPKLRLHSPASIPGIGSILDIPGEDVSVGRSPDNQIVIPESSVASHHARLRRTREGWVLTDLGQSNGIWIGVKRVTEHFLRPGQLIRIGGVALEFVDDANRDDAVPSPAATGMVGSRTEQDSGVRGPASVAAMVPTLQEQGPPAPSAVLEPISKARTEPTSVPQRPPTVAYGKFLFSLLGLAVLGFAVAFGGYVALRWMSRPAQRSRTAAATPSAPALIAVVPAASTAIVPDALLVDREVVDVTKEERLEIPNALKLLLPAQALHTPTHLVVARAGHQGAPFCGVTDYAGPAYEISTLSNPIWAQPANIELPVDVEQLARSRVPAVAIGQFDPIKQVWSLLPTEYDPERRVAKARFWQPALLALFMLQGPDVIATSEHFALLFEPSAKSAKPGHERATKALAQLESALSKYRAAGYRIPNGSLWVCASSSAISRARALMPVVHETDIGRPRSHALARAVFIDLIPGYVGLHALDGREFWFDTMASAIASQSLGVRLVNSTPTSKRLANSLLADDWPSTPLFMNVLSRILDAKIDLFRLWTDTTHVMGELDAKPNAEMQSRVLPIDMALLQATQRNLLSYHASVVAERLSSSLSGQNSLADFCASTTRVPEGTSGVLKLDVPSQYSARWSCVSFDVPAGRYRSVTIQLASELTPELDIQLVRAGVGQTAESRTLSAQAERFDFQSPQMFVVFAVNANMAQSHTISVRYDDVTLDARFENSARVTIRPGQIVSSALQLSKIPPDMKNLDVEWDFGDATVKPRTEHSGNGSIRAEQSHAWDRPGAFTLRAAVFDHVRPAQPVAWATREFTVQPVQLELSVADPNPQPMTDVRVTLKPSGPVPEKVRFRINFGDGTDPSVASSPEATHVFAKSGDYTVIAQIIADSPSEDVLATARTLVSVKASEAPTAVPSVVAPDTVPPQASSLSVQ